MDKTRKRLIHLAIVLAGALALVIGLCLLTGTALASPGPGKLETMHGEAKAARNAECGMRNAELTESEPSLVYAGRYYITGYDTCAQCCGKTDGITASGAVATVGRTCAMSGVDFGTRVYIEGIGERVVEDRGGGVNGQHIDVLCQDHLACYAITGYYDVYFVEAAGT